MFLHLVSKRSHRIFSHCPCQYLTCYYRGWRVGYFYLINIQNSDRKEKQTTTAERLLVFVMFEAASSFDPRQIIAEFSADAYDNSPLFFPEDRHPKHPSVSRSAEWFTRVAQLRLVINMPGVICSLTTHTSRPVRGLCGRERKLLLRVFVRQSRRKAYSRHGRTSQ